MYRNPIIPGFSPDPSITYWNGRYYLVTSTFEYFPGVTIWSSPDLVNWEPNGSVLTRESQLDLSGAQSSSGLYAASIRVNANGRFYMVTTNKFTHENFICHTDDINGAWSEKSFIVQDGIDPSLLFLPDGRCFYTSNGSVDGVRGIKGAFINPDTGELLEPFHLLSTGCGGPATEGPHIYLKDGWYYLMLAEGGTGYGHYEAILRAKDIHGPYEKNPNNPILSHVPRKGHPIQATGHADLIQTPEGEWYAVFLGIRVKPRPLRHHLGRETFLAKVTWEDGWPIVGDNGFVELEYQDGPDQKPVLDYSVHFDRPLEGQYPYLKERVPKPECYILDTQASSLTLVGQEPVNTPLGHPTLLGFRQRGFKELMEVVLDIPSLSGSAGIASWLSSDYHYRLEIKQSPEGCSASLIRHLHDFEAVTESITIGSASLGQASTVKLAIKSDDEFYWFYAQDQLVGKASVYGLAAEGTMYNTFTGALFAVYAQQGKATFRDSIRMESIR